MRARPNLPTPPKGRRRAGTIPRSRACCTPPRARKGRKPRAIARAATGGNPFCNTREVRRTRVGVVRIFDPSVRTGTWRLRRVRCRFLESLLLQRRATMPSARHGLMPLVAIALFAAAPVLQAKAPPAASSEKARIEQILAQRAKVRQVPAVALSYDGQHLAWIVSHGDDTELMLGSWNGRNAHAVAIPGGCREEGLRWAPRWNTLAVLTRCKIDPSNTKPISGAIWLIDVNAGTAPKKLADIDGFASGMQWSRDGKRIAFLYVPGATRLPEATASGNPRVGVIGESDVQVQHVANLAISGGTPQVLTPSDLYVY